MGIVVYCPPPPPPLQRSGCGVAVERWRHVPEVKHTPDRTVLDMVGNFVVVSLNYVEFTALIIQMINAVIQLNGSFKEYIQTNECIIKFNTCTCHRVDYSKIIFTLYL
jgi:hypothetical protein